MIPPTVRANPHEESRGGRVECAAAPLGAAIESGEDDGVLPQRERCEWTRAEHALELLECPGMRLGHALCEQIRRELQAGERRWQQRE